MSARGKVPLPKAVYTLIEAVEGTDAPEAVCMILAAARRACFQEAADQKPVVTLNRSFGQIRRQHPAAFGELDAWLAQPDTEQLARTSGVYWAWAEWRKAAKHLLQGATAGVAFGASRPGRPKGRAFTRYEDAALLADHIRQNEHEPSMVAEATALETCGHQGTRKDIDLDQRSVQRLRQEHRSHGITADELLDQAKAIRAKYQETKS